jgi:hypothetical protein
MQKDIFKISLVITIFFILEFIILNPAFAVTDCNLVCEGDFFIDDKDRALKRRSMI